MKALTKLVCIGACCLTISTLGQTAPNTGNNLQQRVDFINQHVTGLLPDQQSKITAIEEDYLGKCKIVNETATDSLRHSTDNKIRAVLTGEQYAQYQSLTMYPR
jgi:Spy/CpxP family protein refolding chaperone